jgi:hypothetical protein
MSKNSYKNNEAKADIAKRALAEAKERKEKIAKSNLPKELDGRDGPEPTRYNDWEKNGITSDF